MKILVTGGAGYIGTTLVPMLLDRNYEVTVFDKLLFGGDPIIPFFKNKNFHFIKGDIRNLEILKEASRHKDIIIHLAALVGYPICRENPELAFSTNVEGSKNVTESVSKDQYILAASTVSNYGEIESEICTEETPLNPQSIYGKTKTEAEKIIMQHANAVGYRFGAAFGVSPKLRLDLLINEFVYRSVKEKYLVVYEADFLRTFIHVSDMAQSFLFAIDHVGMMKGQIYNVGDETLNYSKRQIAEIIGKETGAHIHYAEVDQDADRRDYLVSYAKIKNLGYRTKVTLEEGIRELIKILPAIHASVPYSNNP